MTNDLISRETALNVLRNAMNGFRIVGMRSGKTLLQSAVNEAWEGLNNIPTVDAAPVVHGRWIEHVHVDEDGDCIYIDYECSACHVAEHFEDDGNRAFCPNCGARMDKEADNAQE